MTFALKARANLRTLILSAAACGLGLACQRDTPLPPQRDPSVAEAPKAPAEPAARPTPQEPPAVESAAAESEDLATEAPEEDPVSQTVKLKLDVTPRAAHAVVWWGKQKLGEPPLTIERPRRSGPMNVVIKANGYLDHHTRLFTDRDDRLSVVLVRPTDAVGMLGYKRKPGQAPPSTAPEGGVPVPQVAPVPTPAEAVPVAEPAAAPAAPL